jgi:alkanesulfonate monooxygenase SsuD/methylene tetrahydromethanopterin reductase-like flavin-dependent oxidoreductase (luciferase family)
MPADVFIDTRDSRSNPIDDAIGQAKDAYRASVKRVWFGQYFDLDAIALAARPPGVEPCPLLVAAMGPRALQVTGELADGTWFYLTGPRAPSRTTSLRLSAGSPQRAADPSRASSR